VSTDDILMWICEVQLVFVMGCDLLYANLEGFVPFQNVHLEDVHMDQFGKIMSTAVI
jgi:hypothetical protein